ncbi:glycosyltransferase family A protein, partial [Campylobacter jejuni]
MQNLLNRLSFTKNQTKTVGVVIPIYNVEKYLRECLDSVVNQTYKNLQVVLVNDGSTDE